MSTVDEISPSTIGEDRIALSVDPDSLQRALQPLTVNLDYEAADPEGVVLPLELIVQPGFGKGDGFIRRIYRRSVPKVVVFTPTAEGDWLVLLREVGHNQWQGRLVVTIEGDVASRVDP